MCCLMLANSSSTPLIEWARARGAKWSTHLEVRDGSRGRGVFAKAPIKNGELLLRLPMALAVRPSPQLMDLVSSRKCSSLVALALTVLHELKVQNPRLPFFEDLATNPLPTIPSLWDETDLVHIDGTSLINNGQTPADAACATKSSFVEHVLPLMQMLGEEFLPKKVHTQKFFGDALAWCISRALQGRLSFEQGGASLWPYLGADGPETSLQNGAGMFLLPLFDLINHSTENKDRCTTLTRVDGDKDGSDAFEMRAHRDLAANEEVLHSYGPHGAAELLRTYGFIETSPHTRIILSVDQVVAAATGFLAREGTQPLEEHAAQMRLDALRKAGQLPVGDIFQVGMTVPPALLTLVQVLVMGDNEVRAWVDAGSIQLGEDWLDEESVSDVIGTLLELVEVMTPVPQKKGAGGQAEVLGAALREEEARVVREFKRGVLMMVMSLGDDADDDEGDEEEDDEEEDEDEDAEAGAGGAGPAAKKRKV